MGKKRIRGPNPVVLQLLGMASEHSSISGWHGTVWPCVPTAQLSTGGHGGDIPLPGTGLSSARLLLLAPKPWCKHLRRSKALLVPPIGLTWGGN